MYKYLIVGCGGSGGSTLAYMMDQLKSELASAGIDKIPAGIQFVHIDVPNAPDTNVPGIGNVHEQGGSYVSTAPQSGSYSVLDSAVSQTLTQSNAIEELATWAPRVPAKIAIPIGNGAGQMRAVGRVITLSKSSAVFSSLERAFQQLNTVETNTEMAEFARAVPGVGRFDPASRPVVLVVSSMAGGAGASMALDVCRLLALVPGVDPALVGVFMVTPDVFDSLNESARGGVRANALAMLGEIVATQTNSAEAHDLAILGGLGHQISPTGRSPFARVFPISRFVGAERTRFGDGSPLAIYRGLGRGLASLVTSGPASGDFVAFDLGNSSDLTPADGHYLGWGTDATQISWGAFGFASLSMGRDRYRHYAAQRLARSATDHLLGGHLQVGNNASEANQIAALLDSQWQGIAERLQIPVTDGVAVFSPDQVWEWLTTTAFPRNEVQASARAISDTHFVPFIPTANNQAQQWLPILRQFMVERKAGVASAISASVYGWGFGWATALHSRISRETEHAIRDFGLPYARAFLEKLETQLRDQLIMRLGDVVAYSPPDLGQIPETFEREVVSMRGMIANGSELAKRLDSQYGAAITSALSSQSALTVQKVLRSMITDVLVPLRDSLSESTKVLTNATTGTVSAIGLANVATDKYLAWPSDKDLTVPPRFGVADNEILLTPAAGFALQYRSDILAAEGSGGSLREFTDARNAVVRQIISGLWPVGAGSQAPGGMLETTASWRAEQFNHNPLSGAPLAPSRAQFLLHLAPHELVGRALQFVQRRGESFDKFCALSLRDFAHGADIAASELPQRQLLLAEKFTEALSRALPLVSVNPDAVKAIHDGEIVYRYKFSSIPFANFPTVLESFERLITSTPNVDPLTVDIFNRALTAEEDVKRIDIFGSYRNYSPLVFDSLLGPVAQQWAATPAQGKTEFWANRRSRPLPASLPMGEAERRAMIAGWYVGQLTGQLRLPDAPYDRAVEVWDRETGRWLQFPHPLLTPPSKFVGKSIDWLPAVLESILLAVSRTHEVPVMSSLAPYQALRGLFDDTRGGAASGLLEASSASTLTQWLASGSTPGDCLSRAEGLDIDDRSAKAIVWLEKIRDYTGTHHLPPDRAGAAGGGPNAIIRTRLEASAAPIFRDLAEDIYVVTGDLIASVTRATTRAHLIGSGEAEMVTPDASTIEPDFGPF